MNKDNEKKQIDTENKVFIKAITEKLEEIFADDIKNDTELEKKYKLKLSSEEKDYIKELQTKYKYLNQYGRYHYFPAMRSVFYFLISNYFNFKTKSSIEQYKYAKEMRFNTFKMLLSGLTQSFLLSIIFYYWMKLLKHKGAGDKLLVFGFGILFSLASLNGKCYNFFNNSNFPLDPVDIIKRKELIEELVFGSNRSIVITNELKFLSKAIDVNEKMEFSFVTPLTASHLEIILYKGKIFINSDDFNKLFGIRNYDKVKNPNISSLNMLNTRERDIIICLLKVYSLLIEKYCDKYKIKMKTYMNPQTEQLQYYIDNNLISSEQVEMMKRIKEEKSLSYEKIFKDIDFSKIDNKNI